MIPTWLQESEEAVVWHHRDATPGEAVAWPSWLPEPVVARLAEAGIAGPWSHQAAFAELAFSGRHAAITTPTASGKTLAYLLPIMAARHGVLGVPVPAPRLRAKPRHTALYLAPTKALAHDQLRTARELGEPGWCVATLDGDSTDGERRFAREHADYVLSNPDMIHHAVLPGHARWSSFLGGLRYIVIDEAHRYRGTFGAHVAQVIRRLRRVCAGYGADPVVLLASATSPNAASFGGALIGEDEVAVVAASGAPRPGLDAVLWRPGGSALGDTTRLLARLVDEGRQTIAFVASRNLAEVIASRAVDQVGPGRAVASYRAGYLAGERRAIESALHSGELTGVAATNALELGVDIAGMDAVIVHGFPGTRAAMWQQFGRAGRAGRDALAVLVAKDDPLDAYLLDHPEALFGQGSEHQVLHPDNPYVLGPHLAAAAQEAPLRESDVRWFGEVLPALADHLASQGLLRRRPAGWYWTRPDRAADFVSLRSLGGRAFEVIESDTGRVVGTVDEAAADKTLHEGAVYLHQGEQYLVTAYEPDDRVAMVEARRSGYYTQPLSSLEVSIASVRDERGLGAGRLYRGEVRLTSQMQGYLRRDEVTGEVWDQTPLEMPSRTFATQATWWTLPDEAVARAGVPGVRVGAGAHAMEHCAIGLLPAFAPCDRWDIGGVSLATHPDTGMATVFVHDGMPGGAGLAWRGYDVADAWLAATLERLTACTCEAGCPACVVSPKCGNANQFLDRFTARDLLATLLG